MVVGFALCLVLLLVGAVGTASLEDYIDMEIVRNQGYYYHDEMRSYMDADNFTQLPADIMARANKDYLSDFDMGELHGYDDNKEVDILEGLFDGLKE